MISTIQTQLIFVTNINGVGTLFEAGLHFPQLNVNGIVLCEVYPENFQAIPEMFSKIPNDLPYSFTLYFTRHFLANLCLFSVKFQGLKIALMYKKLQVSGTYNPDIEKYK